MSAITATVDRRGILPRGWRDFLFQLALWFGFLAAYEVTRGIADRSTAEAFRNGRWIINFEAPHTLWELTFQRMLHSSDVLITAASWTYWGSQFTVLGLALLWAYLRHNEAFYKFRNAIMLANLIGLVGYVLVPTAPPWMFPALGFVDGVNHAGHLGSLANPYAAMPSLHAADALIVGVFLFRAARHWWSKIVWAAWPAWVWFCVLATANHFWLDVLAGILVAIASLWIVSFVSKRRAEPARAAAPIANLL
jgi:membrane-associated phospholipid phosphatase